MTDLHLTYRDRPRVNPRALGASMLLLLAALAFLLYLGHDLSGFLLVLMPVYVVLFALATLGARRAWTRVGPEGISFVDWLGRKRSLSWEQIDWIRVRDARNPVRYVRVGAVGGKAYLLPFLYSSPRSVNPFFDGHAAEVLRLWHEHTGRSPEEGLPAATSAREARLDAFNDGILGSPNPALRMFFPRTGTWQGVVALTCAVVVAQLTLHIPAQTAAAHRYHQTAPCTDTSPTPCLNHDLESIRSTNIHSGWLATPSVVLAATSDVDAYEVDFSTPTAWLSSLRPGDHVYVDWLSDGPVTAIGPADGGPMLRTSDSPDYDTDTSITAATCFAALAILFGSWSAALVRQRFRRVRPPFRRWVPAGCLAALLLCTLGLRSAVLAGPLSVSFFALPATLLAVGLFWARSTTRSRYLRTAD